MHDIDRTQLEADYEGQTYEFEQPGWAGGNGEVFGEAEEMQLASELMQVSNEQELDQFLGSLIKQAGRALGSLVGSPDGQAIGSILKGAAKQLLPHAAGAIGAAFGGPLGAKISSGIASLINSEVGQEAEGWNQEGWNQEGWNQEGRELDGAKQFVRVAADTVRNAMAASGMTDPMSAAQSAIAQAAEHRVPALLWHASRHRMAPYSGQYPGAYSGGESGRWLRRGNRIILFGV
jgi:hypothetical protein